MKPGSINWFKWLAIAPEIVALFDEVIRDLKDGRISDLELAAIGARVKAIALKAL